MSFVFICIVHSPHFFPWSVEPLISFWHHGLHVSYLSMALTDHQDSQGWLFLTLQSVRRAIPTQTFLEGLSKVTPTQQPPQGTLLQRLFLTPLSHFVSEIASN